MLDWLERSAEVAGVGRITLEARASNDAARAFYRRHGYAQAQLLPGYYGGRETSVRMVKDFGLSRTRSAVTAALALAHALAALRASPAPPRRRSRRSTPKPLPLATKRIAASSDECAVWRREQAFARSVEAPRRARLRSRSCTPGTVFNAGTADADRGSDEVAKSWAEIVEGKTIALRWRPGIVQIGGEPTIAISRGPYILQRMQAGAPIYRVGMYQTRLGARRPRRRLARSLRRQRDDRPADGRSRRGRALGRGTGDVRLRLLTRRLALRR